MIKNSPKVIIILGPSAVGKSDIAIALAGELKTAIVSGDAFQIYRGMDIGTGKPSRERQKKIKHYLIDIVNPGENFDAAKFKKEAEAAIEEILQAGKIPLVAGGTGLYIRALTQGICRAPEKNKQLRDDLEKLARDKGSHFLYLRLEKVDPEAARRIHPHDRRRIIRALEVYTQSGIPISRFQRQDRQIESKFRYIKIGLLRPRTELYKRAEERIEEMFRQGWVEEVKKLLAEGYQPELPSMHGLGYREIAHFLSGQISLTRAKMVIKRNTRHFIKRQLTWFKREKDVRWIHIAKNQDEKEILLEIKERLLEKS
ncbi:MAG: tRNA (adenosine(37)-N6)-dimethylallyltransferase MiaA [Candidatus Ratteibacteria bacterium]|nr:tRNA (adenosine(37)-N6)-dimethylallyltransferase MiaA [Candidatus Ratteibacteria bacterium]